MYPFQGVERELVRNLIEQYSLVLPKCERFQALFQQRDSTAPCITFVFLKIPTSISTFAISRYPVDTVVITYAISRGRKGRGAIGASYCNFLDYLLGGVNACCSPQTPCPVTVSRVATKAYSTSRFGIFWVRTLNVARICR